MRVRFVKNYNYAFDGIRTTSFKKDEVADIPDNLVELFREREVAVIDNDDEDKKEKKASKKKEPKKKEK